MIKRKWYIKIKDQILTFTDEAMDDERTCEECRFKEGDELILLTKNPQVQGCAKNDCPLHVESGLYNQVSTQVRDPH